MPKRPLRSLFQMDRQLRLQFPLLPNPNFRAALPAGEITSPANKASTSVTQYALVRKDLTICAGSPNWRTSGGIQPWK